MNDLSFLQYIRFSQLRVTFQADEPIALPPYKGSTFRGCLGDAFKRDVCRFTERNCEDCSLQHKCPFALLYNSPLQPGHLLFGKYTRPPRPYIIIPMPGDKTDFVPGEEFYFELILIGSAIDLLPSLIPVFNRMGKIGIGSHSAKFRPVRLEHYIPSMGYQHLPVFSPPYQISFDQIPAITLNGELNLEFVHPVRFLSARKPYKNPPPFEMLISNLAQRLSLLAHLYCEAPWVDTTKFNFNGYAEIKYQQQVWKDWTRYSGTQDRNLYFDGHLGTICYTGNFGEWQTLLHAGVWLHTGSTATFGLGKYRIMQ